jgi:membrane protease YdiL (CAAX protease family)
MAGISKLGMRLDQNPFYKVGEIVLLLLIAAVFVRWLVPLAGENAVQRQAIIWVANLVFLFFIWAGVRLRGDKCSDWGLTFERFSPGQALRAFGLSLFVLVCAVAGFLLGSIIMANITGIPESADLSSYEYLQNNIGMLLLTLAGVYIVASFGEEVIYRAFFIHRLEELMPNVKYRTAAAVVISSLIFGLAHFDWGPMGMAQTTLMGLALGICYVKLKRRLWILVLAHGYMDTILMLQMYFTASGS